MINTITLKETFKHNILTIYLQSNKKKSCKDILDSNGFFGNGRYRSYHLFCVYFKMKQMGMYIEVVGT